MLNKILDLFHHHYCDEMILRFEICMWIICSKATYRTRCYKSAHIRWIVCRLKVLFWFIINDKKLDDEILGYVSFDIEQKFGSNKDANASIFLKFEDFRFDK